MLETAPPIAVEALPAPIRRVLDALPIRSASTPGLTADAISFTLDQPIELTLESLYALRDQELAQRCCDERGVARWSRA